METEKGKHSAKKSVVSLKTMEELSVEVPLLSSGTGECETTPTHNLLDSYMVRRIPFVTVEEESVEITHRE